MLGKRPIIIGIVGDSATGKTTISSGITKIFGEDRVTHICTDDYHKYDRTERAELKITPLHPECNYMDVMELHLERMHFGQPILKPVYDHANGTLARPEYIMPKQFIVVEGLLGFNSPTLRQFYDIKIYLDPPEELRKVWKIKRDTTKRGYTAEQVLKELEKRENDSQKFIRPQREHADIVVSFYPPENSTPESSGSNLNVKLILRPTIPHPDLSYLLKNNTRKDIRLELGRDNLKPADFLEIDGNVPSEHARELEETIWQHLPDLQMIRDEEYGGYMDRSEIKHSYPLALTQLLLTYHLFRRYSDLSQLPFAQPTAALKRLQYVSKKTSSEK